jgi:hypothetical protein
MSFKLIHFHKSCFSPFIGLQTRYSLLDRSLEFDIQPACAEIDVCIINFNSHLITYNIYENTKSLF